MLPTGLLESVDLTRAVTQSLHDPLLDKTKLYADVLRIDLIHPIISGNKWFKLKYHLQEAKRLGKTGLISFGGAFSNHLLATACSATLESLDSAAIIRGEEPATFPLPFCNCNNME
jgi:D-cysteine desulfhydrase